MWYLIEAIIALIICIIIITITTIIKKGKKIGIALAIAVIIGVSTHLGIQYFSEEPIIEVMGNKDIKIELNGQYVENGAKAFYHFQDVSEQVAVKGNIDTSKVGTYKIEYEVTCGNKKKAATRNIEVVDNVPPEITLNGEARVYASSIELYQEAGFTAADNYDGDITAKVEIETKQQSETTYKKIYKVQDASRKYWCGYKGHRNKRYSTTRAYIKRKCVSKYLCRWNL